MKRYAIAGLLVVSLVTGLPDRVPGVILGGV